MKKKNGVLLIGGEAPDKSEVIVELKKAEIIVAADSGFDLSLEYNILPDMVVGDLDSVQNLESLYKLPPDRIYKYDRDKDETDTEIGVRVLAEKGCDRVVIIGGGGGRLDHLLAILSLFHRKSYPSVWYTRYDRIQMIDTLTEINNLKGQVISFFPAGTEMIEIESDGLKWELNGLEWHIGFAGISNEVIKESCVINPVAGKIIMVQRLKGEIS